MPLLQRVCVALCCMVTDCAVVEGFCSHNSIDTLARACFILHGAEVVWAEICEHVMWHVAGNGHDAYQRLHFVVVAQPDNVMLMLICVGELFFLVRYALPGGLAEGRDNARRGKLTWHRERAPKGARC